MMGGSCPDCADNAPHLIVAMREANMSCPLIASAFIALVRHDTAALSSLKTAGLAGGVHMNETMWRTACRSVPAIKTEFASLFLGCATVASDPCACGTEEAASDIIARPELAFKAGVWWFTAGAETQSGAPCSDLASDASVGVGVRGASVSTSTPGTGFHKIVNCRTGFDDDPGTAQRVRYYEAARQFFTPSFGMLRWWQGTPM